MKITNEYAAKRINGFIALMIQGGLLLIALYCIGQSMRLHNNFYLIMGTIAGLATVISLAGFFVVQPNEARALVFLGKYKGTIRDSGFWWVNPFAKKLHISLRIHNFNSVMMKVNDLQGNPIEIAAVIVWRVSDTAHALFDVENYEQFVTIQSEMAIRTLAALYPYDAHDEAKASLRGSTREVSDRLKHEVQARLELAGIEVYDTCISHLAYAPEIAHAMLRRQQAEAVVAARQKIVEGAVAIVESALKLLSEQKGLKLDEEKKAAMINNLLVTLVSEREAQPVINTGTLYS